MSLTGDGRSGSVNLGIEGIADVSRIGQGSYGTVYRATQSAYGRTVAVKASKEPIGDDVARLRFERECEALGRLSGDPHTVTLYEAGVTSDDHPYLIMEYLSGGSLAARLSAQGPMDWTEVTDIGVEAAAHADGVLHRDVKPENILISSYGEPQLADFGVARVQDGPSTVSGTITGTLAHAAPEVISGLRGTQVSDVWSLSSTLATLLAGAPPFHRDSDDTLTPLITRILTGSPTDLRPLGVPAQVCEVLEAGLAKDTWERPQTAAAFGKALQDAQSSLGVTSTAMTVPVVATTAEAAPEPVTRPEAATRVRAAATPALGASASASDVEVRPHARRRWLRRGRRGEDQVAAGRGRPHWRRGRPGRRPAQGHRVTPAVRRPTIRWKHRIRYGASQPCAWLCKGSPPSARLCRGCARCRSRGDFCTSCPRRGATVGSPQPPDPVARSCSPRPPQSVLIRSP